ncbi:hypothetical protein D3C80_1719310 [compost metagenome]
MAAVSSAGLDVEPAGVNVLLVRLPLPAHAVHDLLVEQELAEAGLISPKELGSLAETLQACGVHITIDELNLGRGNGQGLVGGLLQLVLFRPGAGGCCWTGEVRQGGDNAATTLQFAPALDDRHAH